VAGAKTEFTQHPEAEYNTVGAPFLQTRGKLSSEYQESTSVKI